MKTNLLKHSIYQRLGKFITSPDLEKVIKILANVSQILMLIVVAWGYFYTVVPVFQKEKISEELAKLEIEKSKWQEQVEKYKQEISNSKQEIEELNKIKNELSSNLSNLRTESDSMSKKLNYAEEQLYGQQIAYLNGKSYMAYMNKLGSRFNDKSKIYTAEKLKSDFIQPLNVTKIIVKEIEDSIPKETNGFNKKIKVRLLSDYKKGLENNYKALLCPEPDYKAWENGYNNSLFIANSMCKNRGTYDSSCNASAKYKIELLYIDKWHKAYEPCKQRLLNLNHIILEKKSVEQLLPYGDLLPPSSDEIRSTIGEAIKNHK